MKVASHHLEALDVFRGLSVAAMMLVNNPGDWANVFPPLLHTDWSGWTFADLVFPWFIFTMGVAMPFAFARRRESGVHLRQLHRRIGRRVAMLVALGIVINITAGWPVLFPFRIPGVLQRIGVVYGAASLIVLSVDPVGWTVAIGSLLLAHWAVLTLIPFGGYAAGTLTPQRNIAGYVDLRLFGRFALANPIDPEGLLGTLSATATALIGALVGHALRVFESPQSRLRVLVLGGCALYAAGMVWSSVFILSKPLWTGPYVLVACGLGMLALGVVFFVVEVRSGGKWTRPLVWLGVNPLAMYFLSEVVGHVLEGAWLVRGSGRTSPKAIMFWDALEPAMRPLRPEWASLAFGLAFATVWIAVAGLLYKRDIRIQV